MPPTPWQGNTSSVSSSADLDFQCTTTLETVAASAQSEGNLRVSRYNGQVFTDDLAPVERLIDQIILSYIQNSGR